MNDKRTKVLMVIALVAGGAFCVDWAVRGLFWDPWKKLTQDIDKTKFEIAQSRSSLLQEATVTRDWARIKDRLDDPRPPDIHTNFLAHLGEVFEKVGVAFDVSETPQPQQQGDFKEYVFETKFKLTWGQLVDLLIELHNSREFLKPLRMNIGSQYEKEDRLDLELKISTIEYSLAPVKPGMK